MNKKCFIPTDILIPENTDMTKWSVVACDQYTSQPEYWEEVERITRDSLSTYKITLPEIYLEDDDVDEKIARINKTMLEYIPKMREYKNTFIYVERTLQNGKVRRGLVGAIDLEAYDFSKGSTSLVRATEGTVLERIPPRVKVRENASLELPHIMILADDINKTVIEPLTGKKETFEKIYDFDLMQESGHIKGYLVPQAECDRITAAYEALANGDNPLLFAMGDGNHSLATAKTCYEALKKTMPPDKALAHPARYALAELVNLHDPSLEFEAIHRVVFGTDGEKLVKDFLKYCEDNKAQNDPQTFTYCYEGTEKKITVENPPSPLGAGTLQHFLDGYTDAKIDYIHGADVTRELGTKPGNIGFILEDMPKTALFKTVIKDGALPRKTFSMGHACDKRFYLEARKIK